MSHDDASEWHTLLERKTTGDKGETTHLTRQICVADTSVCPVKRKLCASCYWELQGPLKLPPGILFSVTILRHHILHSLLK